MHYVLSFLTLLALVPTCQQSYARSFSDSVAESSATMDPTAKMWLSRTEWWMARAKVGESWEEIKDHTARAIQGYCLGDIEDGAHMNHCNGLKRRLLHLEYLIGNVPDKSVTGFCRGILVNKSGSKSLEQMNCTTFGTPLKSERFKLFFDQPKTSTPPRAIGVATLVQIPRSSVQGSTPKGFHRFDGTFTVSDIVSPMKEERIKVFAIYPATEYPGLINEISDLPKREAIAAAFSTGYHTRIVGPQTDLAQMRYVEYRCKCDSDLEKALSNAHYFERIDCQKFDIDYTCSAFYYKVLEQWIEVWRELPK